MNADRYTITLGWDLYNTSGLFEPSKLSLKIRAKKANGESQDIQNAGDASAISYSFNGLDPFRNYTFEIYGRSSLGDIVGNYSKPVAGRTKEGVPTGKPIFLSTNATNSTCINVKWTHIPADKIIGYLQGYQMQYYKSTDEIDNSQFIETGLVTEYTACNLSYFTDYTFRLSARNGAYLGTQYDQTSGKSGEYKFGWDESQIMSLERQDLFELFPGDKNLFTRKRVFGLIQGAKKSAVQMDSTSTRLSSTPQSSVVSSDSSFEGGSDDTDLSSATPKHFKLAAKKKFCIEKPNFQLYSDEELKAVEGKESMSPSLQNRLVQSTVANMISGTHQLSTPRYPSFQELAEAARHLCEIYPALNFETLRNKMKRRLQNVRPRRTIQGPKPSRSKYYKQQLQADPINNFTGNETIEDMMGECEEIARDTEMLVKNVQSVMSENRACATSNQKNMTSNRHQENLMREEGKKKPNQDNVNYYMDLLFENRREAIMTEPLFNRHKFLKEKYPSMSNPMQMIQEVRRVLDFTNKDFVENTLGRLEKLIDSLMYYIFSKPELLSSIIIHCPIGCSRDTKLVHILSVVDVLFEKKRKSKDNKCGNKKKINVIQTFENTQDPEQLRKMHPNNGMPGLLIERPTGKSIILIGNQVFTMVDDIKNGFLAFLSLYFVLDVEYQSEYALAFTIMHRLLFLDNRCEENILNDYDETWKKIQMYFPDHVET